MSFESARVGRIVAVRWGKPEIPDLAPLMSLLQRAFKDAGRRQLYLCIIPADGDPPDDATRKKLLASFHELDAYCDSSHVVIEGDGVRSTLNRTIVRGMALVMRRQVTIHKSVAEFVRKAEAELGMKPAEALAGLRAAKMT